MRIIISFTIISFVTDIGWTDNSNESQKDVSQPLVKADLSAPNAAETNHILNAMWAPNPSTQTHLSPFFYDGSRKIMFRKPHAVPKLAKTLSSGLDPFFTMGVFEPFETRPKPITLVAFRNKGFFPRRTVLFSPPASGNSMEIAELQSPFNDISTFWKDNPSES